MRHKWADVINAWANDTNICVQYRSPFLNSWTNAGLLPYFCKKYEWRIKPKAVKKWQWAYTLYQGSHGFEGKIS